MKIFNLWIYISAFQKRLHLYLSTLFSFRKIPRLIENNFKTCQRIEKSSILFNEFFGMPFTFYNYKQFKGHDYRTEWQRFRLNLLLNSDISKLEKTFLFLSCIFYIGKIWPCGMEVSIRGLNLLYYSLSHKTSIIDKFILMRHYNFVIKNNENNGIKSNNHYLTCLVYICIYEYHFYEKCSLYTNDFTSQFCNDGISHEQSTHYHCFSTELLLLYYLITSDENVYDLLCKALSFCSLITNKNGFVFCFGDTDSSSVINLELKDNKIMPLILKLSNEYYKKIVLRLTNQKLTKKNFKFTSYFHVHYFQDSGFLSIKKNDYTCLIKLQSTNISLTSHAHDDICCFEIFYKNNYYSDLKEIKKYTKDYTERSSVIGIPRNKFNKSSKRRILHAFDGFNKIYNYNICINSERIYIDVEKSLKMEVYFTNDLLFVWYNNTYFDWKNTYFINPVHNYFL